MTVSDVRIKAASERAIEAQAAYEVASKNVTAAVAEVARLSLLEYAREHPEVTGLSFESSYEYDDEGGYFLSTSVYPTVADDFWMDDYELADAVQGFGHAAIALLCGADEDAYEGEVTIAEARERRF